MPLPLAEYFAFEGSEEGNFRIMCYIPKTQQVVFRIQEGVDAMLELFSEVEFRRKPFNPNYHSITHAEYLAFIENQYAKTKTLRSIFYN